MFVLSLLLACKPEPPPAPVPGVIADRGAKVFSVNGVEVGSRELDLVYSLMKIPEPRRAEFQQSGEGRHVMEEYAAATVLYQMAVEQQIHQEPDIALELAFTARQLLGSRMRAKLAQKAVTDEAIAKWYEQNKAQFSKPEARARQILVADQVLANDLLARIQNGEDFGQLAAAHSVDPTSKDKGGELGWVRLSDSTLGPTLTSAEPKKVVGPIESRFGFHLVEVHERRDTTPLEDVRDAAATELANEEARVQIEKIRQQMTIEWVNPPAVEATRPSPQMPSGHPPAGGAPPHGGGGGAAPPHGAGGGGMAPHGPGGGGMDPHGGN
jgi:peptidyl-prolyl cis-trans isomerase C